jgi:hypothetical protein
MIPTFSYRIPVHALALSTLLLLGTPAFAGPGHDHDHDRSASASAAAASPRFAAQSDLFEIVGIARNQTLTLYLDRYASNEPVAGAKIEYELNGRAGVAASTPEGTYTLALDEIKTPAELALTFTITAGNEVDLLAGNLSLPDPHAGHDHGPAGWRAWALYGAAGAALLVVVGLLMLALRRRRTGGL